MNKYTEQAKHNEIFHKTICSQFSEQFFDWKITCIFYSAYHLIKALAELKSIEIGSRHNEIMWNMNPRNRQRTMQIKDDAYNAYDEIFEYSRTAQYGGFIDFESFQLIKRNDHEHAMHLYNYLRKYVLGQGVTL